MTEEDMRERIRQLDRRIAEATAWGALLTALNEERKQLLFVLEYADKARTQ